MTAHWWLRRNAQTQLTRQRHSLPSFPPEATRKNQSQEFQRIAQGRTRAEFRGCWWNQAG